MSTKLGTLTLDLIAKVGNFIEPVKKAEKQTKLSFDNMRKHVNTYGTMAVAGAAAVGAGVLAMANEYANAARELQTFASISNTTTQEFQKMAVGAETMGISSEKLADQLKDFNEKLGEFITIGSGGAVDFFEQIAIKTEGSAEAARKLALEMQNLSGPQALQLYVDKLEEAGVTQQQMSFYLESMASDTTNLIPLLKNGGEGFKFWADAAERAGVIMDEHAIEKANELRVQMDLLNLQVKGAKNQFIQGLMPALVSVGNGMTNTTGNTNMLSDAGEALGNVFRGVAAVGMGVYATIKMLSNAIAGLAHDAVAANNIVNAGSEKGSWADKLPGIKFAKKLVLGTTLARAPNSGVSMAAQDNAKIAEDTANMINGLFNDTVSKATAAMAKTQAGQAGVIKGSDEWIKKQNEAAKATRQNTSALRDQNRVLEEQKRIVYEYSTADDQKSLKLAEEIERLKSNGMSQYVALAQARYDQQKALNDSQLEYDLYSFRMNEKEKLTAQARIDEMRIKASNDFSEEEKQSRIKALKALYDYEIDLLNKAEQDKLSVLRDSMTEQLALAQSSRLDSLAQVVMTPSEKAQWSLQNDQSSALGGAYNNYQANLDEINSEVVSEQDKHALLLQAEQVYQEQKHAIIQEYAVKEADLAKQQKDEQLASYESLFGSMAGLTKSFAGEQSGAYRVMFGLEKAMAVARSMINIQTAMSSAAMSLPFPGNLAAMATVASQTAGIISTIKSVQAPSGIAHGGMSYVPKETTYLLDKGERVLSPNQNRDLTNFISNQGASNGANIVINNNANTNVTARQGSDGKVYVTVDELDGMVATALSRPNSKTSKSMQQNTNAGRRR